MPIEDMSSLNLDFRGGPPDLETQSPSIHLPTGTGIYFRHGTMMAMLLAHRQHRNTNPGTQSSLPFPNRHGDRVRVRFPASFNHLNKKHAVFPSPQPKPDPSSAGLLQMMMIWPWMWMTKRGCKNKRKTIMYCKIERKETDAERPVRCLFGPWLCTAYGTEVMAVRYRRVLEPHAAMDAPKRAASAIRVG